MRFDAGSRALHATDASNYRQVPVGVVVPRSKEDDIHTTETCRRHEVPIPLDGGRRAEIHRALDSLRRKHGDLIRDRIPDIPRRVSGYSNLDQLFDTSGFNVARALVGTEETSALVIEATLDLIPDPPCRTLAILGFPDI